MSSIEVTVGAVTVSVGSRFDSESADGTMPHYRVRDLIGATTAALLAINTPESVQLANAMPE